MKKLHRIILYLYICAFIITSFSLIFSSREFTASHACANFPNDFLTRGELDTRPVYKLPVIMYHSTFKKNPGTFNVPPAQLEKDFSYLKENGYSTITISDLINFQEKAVPLPKKPVMLTFDDGYTNNYLYLYPLLKECGFKCVISVIGFLTDRNYKSDTETPKPTCAHMDYSQIKELSESGIVEIQNHTYNMHHYGGNRYGLSKRKNESPTQYEENLTNDLKKLDGKLKEHCNITTTAVIYPYGAYSTETVPILKKMGYKASFTCRAGINEITRTSSLFNLKRNNRPYGQTSEQYFGKILKDLA